MASFLGPVATCRRREDMSPSNAVETDDGVKSARSRLGRRPGIERVPVLICASRTRAADCMSPERIALGPVGRELVVSGASTRTRWRT